MILSSLFLFQFANAQSSPELSSCKMYLNGKTISDVTKELALEWCELIPPTVMCSDGKVYQLERFSISFLTLDPFMNTKFGIGERGIPIKAVLAVEKGKEGDALILREVVYINEEGIESELPVISFKLK